MAKTLRFQHHNHIGSNDFGRHNKYGRCAISTHSGTYPNDRNIKSIGRQQLVGKKNISVQCLISHRARSVLGESNRNFIIAHSAIFRHNHAQSRKLLRQPSPSLS